MVSIKSCVLGALCFVISIAIFIQGPIPQPVAYHDFADQLNWGPIPNGSNVVSNIGFLIVGLWGLYTLRYRDCVFENWREKNAYWVVFTATTAVAFGSGYYHMWPNNDTLFWDRLPMTVTFMSIVSILLTEKIHDRLGILFLFPLIIIGVLSLLWWVFTEWHTLYVGDLRFYIMVQAAPVVMTPVMIYMYEDRYTLAHRFYWCCACYVLAKMSEVMDHEVFHFTGEWISGHALKHILAAIGGVALIPMIRHRRLVSQIKLLP